MRNRSNMATSSKNELERHRNRRPKRTKKSLLPYPWISPPERRSDRFALVELLHTLTTHRDGKLMSANVNNHALSVFVEVQPSFFIRSAPNIFNGDAFSLIYRIFLEFQLVRGTMKVATSRLKQFYVR